MFRLYRREWCPIIRRLGWSIGSNAIGEDRKVGDTPKLTKWAYDGIGSDTGEKSHFPAGIFHRPAPPLT
jgi:hypothetical protein